MKISEVIAQLTKLQQVHGDLLVYPDDGHSYSGTGCTDNLRKVQFYADGKYGTGFGGKVQLPDRIVIQ